MSRFTKNSADSIAASCLVARIRLLNRRLTRIYDEALRPVGVKAGQIGILVAMARLGSASPGDIGSMLEMEKSTVSRNLEVLRKQGWLEVLPGEDERSHRLRITSRGKRLLDRALPRWEKAQEEARSLLGRDGAAALLKMVPLST